jgi:hypothetical protein
MYNDEGKLKFQTRRRQEETSACYFLAGAKQEDVRRDQLCEGKTTELSSINQESTHEISQLSALKQERKHYN